MSEEPENLVLKLLRDMRAEMADMRAELKGDIGALRDEFKSDMHSLRADIAADFIAFRAEQAREHKQTREQVAGLRQAVTVYHATVVGHGVLISELDERLRRVERRLDMPPAEAH